VEIQECLKSNARNNMGNNREIKKNPRYNKLSLKPKVSSSNNIYIQGASLKSGQISI